MDYLRQLRNDEKRCTFSMVGTLTPDIAVDIVAQPLYVIPVTAVIARMYMVTKQAFAAGSTVDITIYAGSEAGETIFTAVPLDTAAAVTMGPGDSAGVFTTDEHVAAVFNQAAVDSAVGEAQLVIEFTEVSVKAGAYSK